MAMLERLRIAVAGCGPAGLAAALLLARDGHSVTVFERFAQARPVGSGLMIQPVGLAVLRAMGLDAAVVEAGARVGRLFGRVMPSGRTVLDVRYRALGAGLFGVGVHRASLFRVLHGAVVAAGVELRTGHVVTGTVMEGEGRWLLVEGGARAGPFDLVVDAMGTGSAFADGGGRVLDYGALWATVAWPGAGFDAAALEQRYVAARRMVGVLPIGGGQAAFFWSLRVDGVAAWRAAGLDAWKTKVREIWPETAAVLEQIAEPEMLTFARYSHRTRRRPVAERLVHIGDAWHSASPQLGQGANMALLDAYALALSLRRKGLERGLAAAVRLRRRHVWTYQIMSAMFTPAYQGDGLVLPFMRDRLIGPANGVWPVSWVTAAMVAGVVGWPLRSLGLRA